MINDRIIANMLDIVDRCEAILKEMSGVVEELQWLVKDLMDE